MGAEKCNECLLAFACGFWEDNTAAAAADAPIEAEEEETKGSRRFCA